MSVQEGVPKKGFTFIWKIENFSFSWHNKEKNLHSPEFEAQGLDKVRWLLSVCPRDNGNSIGTYLWRSDEDKGPSECVINYSISVVNSRGVCCSYEIKERSFTHDYGYGVTGLVKCDEIPVLPQDSLTVTCYIWTDTWKPKSNQVCHATTRLKIDRNIFIWSIENFISIPKNVRKTQIVTSIHDKKSLFKLQLLLLPDLLEEESFQLNIVPNNSLIPCKVKCELSAVDIQGMTLDIVQGEHVFAKYDKEGKSLASIIKRSKIIAEKNRYLPNGVLTLRCNCAVADSIEYSCIEELHTGPSQLLEAGCCATETLAALNLDKSICSKKKDITSLTEDLSKLFLDHTFSDLELHVRGEVFLVHKAVLSARSPVFSVILSKGKSSWRTSHFVEITDLEINTVRNMLLYMYTDTTENLQWGDAMNLYVAADKYDVGSLKKHCSSVLSLSLNIDNICQVLSLAERYADQQLKENTQNYIYQKDTDVIGTTQWKELMKKNALLVAEIMQWMYMKKSGCI